MTMPEVSCKTCVQNNSQWTCSMCPIPQLRLVGVRISYIYFFCMFPGHQVLDLITNPYLGGPLAVPCYTTNMDGCGFFNSIVVRLPFNSISDGSE